jgi:hypothetical protein
MGMKKQPLITIIILFFCISGICGCNEKQNNSIGQHNNSNADLFDQNNTSEDNEIINLTDIEKNKFIGVWIPVPNGDWFMNYIYVYYPNETYYDYDDQKIESGIWKIENGKLCFGSEYVSFTFNYDYFFSENNNTLNISYPNFPVRSFHKMRSDLTVPSISFKQIEQSELVVTSVNTMVDWSEIRLACSEFSAHHFMSGLIKIGDTIDITKSIGNAKSKIFIEYILTNSIIGEWFFQGCSNDSQLLPTEWNKFIGTWNGDFEYYYIKPYYYTTKDYTFLANGSVSSEDGWMKWTLDDGNLIVGSTFYHYDLDGNDSYLVMSSGTYLFYFTKID